MEHTDKLNKLQLNLLKSLQYIHSENKVQELDSLINYYLEKKLDEAIESVEEKNNFNAQVYEGWLNEQRHTQSS